MNDVSIQNIVPKVSAAKDSIQSKDKASNKADSTFKSVLDGVSSDKNAQEKKSLNVPKNALNNDKAEVKADSNIDAAKGSEDKAEVLDSKVLNNKNEAESSIKAEVVDDSKTTIKLSSEELSKLEAFIEKLQSLDGKTSSDGKPEVNIDNVLQLLQMNLVKINNAIEALKNKSAAAVTKNDEIGPAQIDLDFIDELSKMQNQLTDIMNLLSNSNSVSDNPVNALDMDELKDELSEHSMNAEKNDTKDSDIILELSGMASILSQVAAMKTEQIENADNKSEKLDAKEALNEVRTLGNSIGAIKELLVNSKQVNPEDKKDYLKLAQLAENIVANKNNNSVVAIDKLKLKEVPETKDAISNILKVMTNNNENLEVDLNTGSEIEKLLNKFVQQANELEQKVTLSNEAGDNELIKNSIQNITSVLDDTASKTTKKLVNEVRRKVEGGDEVFDKDQNKFVIYEEKTDKSFVKENSIQTANSGVKTDNSSLTKEDKLLLKLTSDDKSTANDDMSSKIARVTNLATSLQVEKNIPVEAAEKLPMVNRQTFNEDVVKSIKYMELNQIKELTVKIMPKELGELFIKITREGEVVKAQITATNKEAFNLLNSNLSDITKQLSEQNIKIHSFNVEIFNGDSSFYNQGSKNENGNSQSKRKSSFDNLEVEEVSSTEDILDEISNVNALA